MNHKSPCRGTRLLFDGLVSEWTMDFISRPQLRRWHCYGLIFWTHSVLHDGLYCAPILSSLRWTVNMVNDGRDFVAHRNDKIQHTNTHTDTHTQHKRAESRGFFESR